MDDTLRMKCRRKRGATFTDVVFVIVVVLLLVVPLFGWMSRHVIGNKQIVDFNHQKFTAAYVLGDSNAWTKVKVKAWKDWKDSDAVQIVTEDGKAVYTHLMNVKLIEE